MYFVYSLLLALAFLVLLPRFLFDAIRHGKYVAGFRERMGNLKPIASANQPIVWLHCVSVGETQAARPLVKSLREQFPNYTLVVSTITATGQKLASEVFRDSAARVFYFPFDWSFTARRALEVIQPDAVFLMETEIWPGFLRECQRKNIPVGIINGRLSDHSFRRYRFIRPFISRVLNNVQIAVMQTDEDADRIRGLGIAENKVFVAGNLKFDAGAVNFNEALSHELAHAISTADRPLILAASTHAPEERILIETFHLLCATAQVKPRLMIAPRHPERFSEVAQLMQSSGYKWNRRTSQNESVSSDVDLILLDTIGELTAVYPLATIVFVGGSIARVGGHNLLEPAAVGTCIVTGPYTFNFKAIVRTFLEADALVQLPPLPDANAPAELAHIFEVLLTDSKQRLELGHRARKLVQENQGATARTIELIRPILASAGRHESTVQAQHVQSA